jgi:hypothetical protein
MLSVQLSLQQRLNISTITILPQLPESSKVFVVAKMKKKKVEVFFKLSRKNKRKSCARKKTAS